MKAKRFILMLLVMLMIVTGAWANQTELASFFPNQPLTSDYVKLTVVGTTRVENTDYFIAWKSGTASRTKVEGLNGAKIKQITLWYYRSDISGNLTAAGETMRDYYALVRSVEFENSVSSATIEFSGTGTYVYCQKIDVVFEYPDHVHHYANDWHSDDTYHWHECDSKIGICDGTPGNKAAHNYGESGAAYYTCQTCGYVSQYRQHTHVPAATWSIDADHHWHACVGTEGLCDGTKLDMADHTYGESGEAYYTCQICGYVNEYRHHQHVPAETWSHNKSQHWHACQGHDGICNTPKLDLADHTYGDTPETYYTCQVCGYEDAERRKEATADYFSMTATGGDITIGMTKRDLAPQKYYMQYSQDKIHWTNVTLNSPGTIVTIPAGQTYFFRSSVEDIHALATHEGEWCFTMTGRGTVQAAGNLYSLLGMTYATSITSPELDGFMFSLLFYGCSQLTAVQIYNFNLWSSLHYPFKHWLDGTAAGTTGVITLPDNMVDADFLKLPSNWICKQKVDYIDQVKDAAADIVSSDITSLIESYSDNIKNAVGNSAAKAQRDIALKSLQLYTDGYNHGSEDSYSTPTEPGLRLKVTKKDGNVYEFQTIDLESVEYYRAE